MPVEGSIPTALGAVDEGSLGRVLPHEHIFINMMREVRIGALLNDEELMVAELQRYREQGGTTVIDLTTAELTWGTVPGSVHETPAQWSATRSVSNVRALQRVSERSGVHIVLGTGRYREPYLDKELIDQLGVAGLRAEMLHDLEDGFADTGVQAGLIGEIGSDKWFVSALEERVLRAAARAHLVTNAAVYTHSARWPVALAQLDILTAEGMDPRRVAVGHVDTVPDARFALELAHRGVFIGLDTINSVRTDRVARRVDAVIELVRNGHLDQILLSHDVCKEGHLHSGGGEGYGFILGGFREALLKAGLSSEEFEHIVVVNPRRLLARS